jgi:hypothetical protein
MLTVNCEKYAFFSSLKIPSKEMRREKKIPSSIIREPIEFWKR